MSNLSKLFAVVVCVLLVLGLSFAGGTTKIAKADTQKFTLGFSQFWGTNPVLIAVRIAARQAAADWKAKGVEVDLIFTNGGDTDVSRQVADIEDLYAQQVNGLMVFPGDATVIAEPVKNVFNKNDIPVVVIDNALEAETVSTLVTDNYEGGKIAAELAIKNIPQGSKVIVFDHAPGSATTQQRYNGFEETAANAGMEVLARKLIKLSLEDAKKAMEDTLVSDPEVAAVFLANQIEAQGCVSALEAAGRDDVVVLGFDIDGVSLDLVKQGKILGLVVQDFTLMGYEGINRLLLHLTGQPVGEQRVDIPPQICTQENAAEFENNPQVTGKE